MSSNTTSARHSSVTRAAATNSAATGICRILGYVRDAVIASVFGTSWVNSAFCTAFAVPNTFRRLFGEGAMASSFIPLFAEEIHLNGRDAAFRAARMVLTLLGAFLSVLGIVVSVACLVLAAAAPVDDRVKLTFVLTAIMMPYSVLICLTAVCGAVLNTLGHFSRPALAPVFLNIAMIAGTWVGTKCIPGPLQHQIYALAGGVLAGGVLQLWFQLPALRARGFTLRFLWMPEAPLVRRMFRLMGPAIIGAGVSQINVLVDRFMALALNDRASSVLTYADRLVELPLGVFGIALATAALPAMSFCAARNDHNGLVAALGFALRHVCYIMVPAAIGLVILREPIVRLLFERGAFSVESTRHTAFALAMYAPGLLAFAFAKIIVPTFYARKDTATPLKIGVVALALNVVLNYILMHTWLEEAGLALSTSLCAYLNVVALLVVLRMQCGALGMRAVAVSVLRIAAIGAAMAALVMGARIWTDRTVGHAALMARCVCVVVPLTVGLAAYAVLSFVLRQRELMELLAAYFRRRSPRTPNNACG